MAKGGIKDIDKGFKRVMALGMLPLIPSVRVGIQGSKGTEIHDDGSGIDMVNLAAVHEFGTNTIPERSFIRSTFDENVKKWGDLAVNGVLKILDGKMTFKKLANLLGLKAVTDMKKKIASNIGPPLKPGTISARKRQFGAASSKTLIATGALQRSITYVVVEGTESEEGSLSI